MAKYIMGRNYYGKYVLFLKKNNGIEYLRTFSSIKEVYKYIFKKRKTNDNKKNRT